MNYLIKITAFLTFLTLVIVFSGRAEKKSDSWDEDFYYQRISERPDLEVSSTDSSTKSFIVSAEDYQLKGLLEKTHMLINEEGENLVWFEMNDREGNFYSTRNTEEPSRINLYQRGPYFSEIHWFDLELAEKKGNAAPLRGDLTLYCYPEKVLAEIKWYSTGELEGGELYIKGINLREYVLNSFTEDTIQGFSFPLFGEEPPLSDSAFQTLVGEVPFKYDHRKGYYVVGTHTSKSFQKEFYEPPNRYETAIFSVSNDYKARKIYICHESAIGGQIMEGGMVLNEEEKALPLVVQVSKNLCLSFYHSVTKWLN